MLKMYTAMLIQLEKSKGPPRVCDNFSTFYYITTVHATDNTSFLIIFWLLSCLFACLLYFLHFLFHLLLLLGA